MEPLFKGVIPALVTPYTQDDEINYDAAAELIERLLRCGVSGFFVCGTTGEWSVLSVAERKAYAEHVVRVVAGRVKIMVHCCAPATRDAIELARHAEEIGADAISSLPPVCAKYSEQDVWNFLQDIAGSVSLPFYAYHLPAVFGELVDVRTFLDKLTSIPNLAGLKYSSSNFEDLTAVRRAVGDRVNIISGGATRLLPAIKHGADGSVCAWHNLLPRPMIEVIRLLGEDRGEDAEALFEKACAVIAPLVFSYLGSIKWLLGLSGIPCGRPRKPLPDLSAADRDRLLRLLEEMGAFELFV